MKSLQNIVYKWLKLDIRGIYGAFYNHTILQSCKKCNIAYNETCTYEYQCSYGCGQIVYILTHIWNLDHENPHVSKMYFSYRFHTRLNSEIWIFVGQETSQEHASILAKFVQHCFSHPISFMLWKYIPK